MSFSPSFFFFFSFVPFEPNIHLYKTQQQQKKQNQILFGSIFPTKKNLCLSFQKHKSFINKNSYILFNTHHWHTATSWETMKLHHYANLVVTHVITALWRKVDTPPGSFVSTTVKQEVFAAFVSIFSYFCDAVQTETSSRVLTMSLAFLQTRTCRLLRLYKNGHQSPVWHIWYQSKALK